MVLIGDVYRIVAWTAAQRDKLGWMAIGFGRNMGDSPMVVVWPSHSADGEYNSVALLQCKVLYEVMPTPDPHPPFAAKLSLTDTDVTVENPQIAFTCNAPGSADSDGPISPHHKIGRGMLNVTCIPTIPAEPPVPVPPPPPKAEDESESDDEKGGNGSFCARRALYRGFLAHVTAWRAYGPICKRDLKSQGVPDAPPAVGSCLFPFPQVGGAGLVLLYVMQCPIWSCVHRIPEESRTDVHGTLLAGLGGVIILPAFFETWLGLISGRPEKQGWWPRFNHLDCPFPRRFGSVKEDAKGEYAALDMRPPSNDELEDGDEKL
ncbi:hypothetical protein EDB83DRAFT_2678792 [Lactarius deliciosus]|nr:hypothetical protein EDB83DRAFT_2678792 [Lactarius deliciosus]